MPGLMPGSWQSGCNTGPGGAAPGQPITSLSGTDTIAQPKVVGTVLDSSAAVSYPEEFYGHLFGNSSLNANSWQNIKTVYGAVGDGVTDDTAAFQSAFNNVARNTTTPNPVLYIPPGTYLITSQLTIGQGSGDHSVPDPTTAMTLNGSPGGTGTIPAGTYDVVYTWKQNFSPLGYTLASPRQQVTVDANGQLQVTIPQAAYTAAAANLAAGQTLNFCIYMNTTGSASLFMQNNSPNGTLAVNGDNTITLSSQVTNTRQPPFTNTTGQGIQGGTVVGHSHADTTIKWGGGTGPFVNGQVQAAIRSTGNAYMWWGRFTFDGGATCVRFFEEAWHSGNYFPTSNTWSDVVVQNMHPNPGNVPSGGPETTSSIGWFLGITGGNSETSMWRIKASWVPQSGIHDGVFPYNANSLDTWIWDSQFENLTFAACVTDSNGLSGDGQGTLNNCNIINPAQTAVHIGNTNAWAMRWCYQTGGNRAFSANNQTNASCPTQFQGNTFIDPASGVVNLANGGGLFFVDNTVRCSVANQLQSQCGVLGGSTLADGGSGFEFGVGNSFSAASGLPVFFNNGTTTKVRETDDSFSQAISDPGQNALDPEPPATTRTVYEPTAYTFSAIQTAINNAVAGGTARPVVHLPAGTYLGTSSITLPASFPMTIMGDGWQSQTLIKWNNATASSVFSFAGGGPCLVMIRDLTVHGNQASDCFNFSGVNQTDGFITLRKMVTGGESSHGTASLYLSGLTGTTVQARDCGWNVHSGATNACVRALGGSKLYWFNGTIGNSTAALYDVEGGSVVVAASVYNEFTGGTTTVFYTGVGQSGTVVLSGNKLQGGGAGSNLDPTVFDATSSVCIDSIGISSPFTAKLADNTLYANCVFSAGAEVGTATGTALGIGTYLYQVTFQNGSGETTGCQEISLTTTAAVNGSLSGILTGPPGTTARGIYRTGVNGLSGSEKLVAYINDNTTTTYTDSTPDASLGAAIPVTNSAGIAPPGQPWTGTATKYGVWGCRQDVGNGSANAIADATGSGITDSNAFTRTALSALRNAKPVQLSVGHLNTASQIVLQRINTTQEVRGFVFTS